jgi:hypothetical protein
LTLRRAVSQVDHVTTCNNRSNSLPDLPPTHHEFTCLQTFMTCSDWQRGWWNFAANNLQPEESWWLRSL